MVYILDLNKATDTLEVQKRRIYDITNETQTGICYASLAISSLSLSLFHIPSAMASIIESVWQVFVMRPKARNSLRPNIFRSPVTAAAAASVTSAYALSKSEKLDFMQLDDINSKSSINGHPLDDVTVKIEAIKEEKRLLELSIAEVRAENSKFGGEIDEVNSTHAELTKELQSDQGQLVGERSRCFNLEEKIAELQKLLESMQSVDDQVQALCKQKFALEQEMELAATAQEQSSGGVWRWLSGGET